MKITLVSVFPDLTAFGLRHIGACLSDAGHDIQIIFLPDEEFEEICSVPGRYKYRYPDSTMNQVEELSRDSELACISLFSCYIPQAIQLTERFKQMKIPVLWGGKHPSALPEESLDYADMVCIGEGELAIIDLVKRMESGGDYFDTEGFHFNTPDGIKENGAGKLVEDLDTLPWIDYDFCPHYVWEKEKDVLSPISSDILKRHLIHDPFNKDGRIFEMMMTRGCPFGCTYCFTFKNLYKDQEYVRSRTVESFIQEMEAVIEKYDFITHLSICDDEFMAQDITVLEEFASLYKERIGLPFSALASPWHINETKLKPLVDAGLCFAQMGIETVSKTGRRAYKRNISTKKIMKAVDALHVYKDKVLPAFDFIVDDPWENTEDVLENIRFILDMPKPYDLHLFSLVLFPGTKMYDDYWEVRDTKFPDFQLDYMKLYKEYRRTYLNFIFQLLNHRVPRPIIRLMISKPFVYIFEEKGVGSMFFVLRDFLRATGTLNIVKRLRRVQAVRG